MAHYFIGIGGTGARCLEAVVYLASAGLINGNLHVLIIDPDANNGNSSAVDGLMTHYYMLQAQRQPNNPQLQRKFRLPPTNGPAPVLFQANVNSDGRSPARWNVQQRGTDRYFRNIVEYTSQPEKLRNFLDLFYQSDDLNMELEVGYQGRTNVGAVALKQDLEETREINESGLREFLVALTEDLQNGETKVFVSGSVFGGTGAAGIPTLPALIRGLDDKALPEAHRKNLRWGCVLMAPYFVFPRNSSTNDKLHLGPGTDSSRHPVATQAALLHYAHTPPGYQRIYLLGAPNRGQTNTENHPGGDEQKNLPHYTELAAALAAWDFYGLAKIKPDERKLHYADSFDDKGRDLEVSWGTLPVLRANYQKRREEVKQKLVSFTTFAYLYRNILHDAFISNRAYLDSQMYQENFANLNLDGDEQELNALNSLCDNYLEWLKGVGRTGGNIIPALFNWEALEVTEVKACEQRVGNLMESGTQSTTRPPRYSTTGYQKIMEKLNRTRLVSPNTQSAVGLFVYLLSHAVNQFCKENYDWHEVIASGSY